MQFTKRKSGLEKMRLPKGKLPPKKWNRKGNLSYFSKKRNMSDVLEKSTNPPFFKTFERRLLGREKKLEENFGSEETWESKKRPGTDFKLQEPSRSEIVRIFEKNTYENSKKRRVQT